MDGEKTIPQMEPIRRDPTSLCDKRFLVRINATVDNEITFRCRAKSHTSGAKIVRSATQDDGWGVFASARLCIIARKYFQELCELSY